MPIPRQRHPKGTKPAQRGPQRANGTNHAERTNAHQPRSTDHLAENGQNGHFPTQSANASYHQKSHKEEEVPERRVNAGT